MTLISSSPILPLANLNFLPEWSPFPDIVEACALRFSNTYLATLVAISASTHAIAGSLDHSLLLLDPEERAHQVCIARGIDDLNRADKSLRVDRLKTSIFSRATFDGATVKAPGGAFRAKRHWYKLKFTCDVTENQMKATTFTYQIGTEVPKEEWEDLGLWE